MKPEGVFQDIPSSVPDFLQWTADTLGLWPAALLLIGLAIFYVVKWLDIFKAVQVKCRTYWKKRRNIRITVGVLFVVYLLTVLTSFGVKLWLYYETPLYRGREIPFDGATTIAELAATVTKQTGLSHIIYSGIEDQPAQLFGTLPWDQALAELCQSADCTYRYDGGVLRIGPSDVIHQAELFLADDLPQLSPVRLNLQNAHVKDALGALGELGDYNIIVKPGVEERVTLEYDDVPWPVAVSLVCGSTGLRCELGENNVIVAQKKLRDN